MNTVAFLLKLIDGYKTYASVILTIVSGLGMILSKNYGEGLNQVFQGLTVIFGGASVASVRHSLSKVEAQGSAKAPASARPSRPVATRPPTPRPAGSSSRHTMVVNNRIGNHFDD